MRFRTITIGASITSNVLWVSAASIATVTGELYSFIIVGLLAGVSQIIAVNSAKREGYDHAKESILQRILGEVGE